MAVEIHLAHHANSLSRRERAGVRAACQPMAVEIHLAHHARVVDHQLDPHQVAAERVRLLMGVRDMRCMAAVVRAFDVLDDAVVGHPSIFDKVLNLVYVGPGTVLCRRDDRPGGDALNCECVGESEKRAASPFLATMQNHVAVYVRVSSKRQDQRSQLPDLERWAGNQTEPVVWYRDKFTGKSMNRPGWDKLQRAMDEGSAATVV
jgi:hypothetical protein